ncbi:hypothetical protein PAGU2196_34960 [Pseudomonas sp. PAGU 2196]|uniref:PAS domain-containing protein n=1 Tax=Pseudomonas sp. PAGU 2196 TaxID=2793997 RepID=UPI001EDEDE3E|nr:PAS domain-containing protein [Pseudomonas sp. PAGU 2196]GHS82662.1 hypothetical protein PAGU2196_34960 [Pseudomonas sp. PAGU 2196]
MAFYSREHLEQLRNDATFNQVDTARARIERTANDAFMVILDDPLVDITTVLGIAAPRAILCTSITEAEGELLVQCLRIQRAERQKVRQGRVFGWSPEQVCRRPLTDEELSTYRAEVKHRAETARLIQQLNEALEGQKRDAATQAGIDHLTERYGLVQAKPTVPNANTVKADPSAAPIYAGRHAPTARKGARK